MSVILRSLATLVSAMLFAPTLAQAQTTTLRYSNWLPPGQAMRVEVIEPWIAEVEKVTNGRVKVETLPKVVGSLAAQFDVARDGQADIVVFIGGYTPGRFEINEVFELPFMSDDPELYSGVVYRFYRKHVEQYGEFKGVHILSTYVVSPGQFFTSKRKMRTISDFKGLKVRSPGPVATHALTLMGATPVSKPSSETYELVSSGVLDGTMMPPESMPAWKLEDLLPNMTIVPGGFYNTVLNLAINEAKWKSLSKEDQEAIMRISGEKFGMAVGRAYKRGDQATIDGYRKTGKSVEVLGPQVAAEMRELLRPVEQAWMEKARKRGVVAPEKLIEALRSEIAAAKAGR